jgi:hypothetical protein
MSAVEGIPASAFNASLVASIRALVDRADGTGLPRAVGLVLRERATRGASVPRASAAIEYAARVAGEAADTRVQNAALDVCVLLLRTAAPRVVEVPTAAHMLAERKLASATFSTLDYAGIADGGALGGVLCRNVMADDTRAQQEWLQAIFAYLSATAAIPTLSEDEEIAFVRFAAAAIGASGAAEAHRTVALQTTALLVQRRSAASAVVRAAVDALNADAVELALRDGPGVVTDSVWVQCRLLGLGALGVGRFACSASPHGSPKAEGHASASDSAHAAVLVYDASPPSSSSTSPRSFSTRLSVEIGRAHV